MGPDDAGPMLEEPQADGLDRSRTRARVLAGLFGAPEPRPQVIAGRFEVVGRLGSGAMGEVLLAQDRELGRRVALKRLTASRRTDASRRRILREARALAQVHHPHVVTLFEARTDGDDVLLAMEYVRGQTLREWLTRPRSRSEIIETMYQAARGLAAVHRAGLVHRDFKPDNVLVGDDGRVRVADLGLARLEGASEGSTGAPVYAGSEQRLESGGKGTDPDLGLEDEAATGSGRQAGAEPPLTRTGALVGTPVYMAPEQLAGAPADAMSDQFAFGVSLHEALFGMRPFEGETTRALAEAIRAGRRQTMRRRAPRWLERVLDRTLQGDPGRRYGSMDEVAWVLEPTQRRRRRVALVAGVGGLGAIMITSAALSAPAADPCPRATTTMEEAWSPSVQEEVRGRVATEVEAADAEFLVGAISERASAYSEAWLDEQQGACRQTRVDGLHSEADLHERMRCLERRRETFAALLGRVPAMNRDELVRMPQALSKLASPATCTTDGSDEGIDPGLEAVVALVDRARAEVLLADYDDSASSLAQAEEALGQRQAQGLRAEIAFGRAEVARGRGEDEEADALYLQAAEQAEASRRDRLAAMTWLRLVASRATEGRDPERAEFYLSRARAAVARLGHPPLMQANLLHKIGQQALTAGRHAEAVEALVGARRLYRSAEADALTIAPVEMDLGRAQYQRGDYAEAAQAFREVVAVYEAEYGQRHPRVASALNNLGSSLVLADRLDEAVEVLRRALAIRRERLGPRHGKVGQTLNALASVHLQRGENEEALTLYREALAVQTEAYGADHGVLVATMSNIGRALSRLGRHDEAIVELSRAIEIVSGALGGEHPDVADALHGLAAAQLEAGKADAAVDTHRNALEIRRAAFGDEAAKTAESGVALAEALARAGETHEAKAAIARWLPVLRNALGDEHPEVQVATATRDRLRSGEPTQDTGEGVDG